MNLPTIFGTARKELLDDEKKLLHLIETEKWDGSSHEILKRIMSLREECTSWNFDLESQIVKSKDFYADFKDNAFEEILQQNILLWMATICRYVDSPYQIFSKTNGMIYLDERNPEVCDTNPIFPLRSTERLLGIILHPFFYGATSEDLNLILRFSVIVSIGATRGWIPQPSIGGMECELLWKSRNEMTQVSRADNAVDSIYARFVRLSKQYPGSLWTLVLEGVSRLINSKRSENIRPIQVRQEEIFNQEGIWAVTDHDLDVVCQAIDNLAFEKKKICTRMVAFKFKNRDHSSLRFHGKLSFLISDWALFIKKVWIYESHMRRSSLQKSQHHVEHIDGQDQVPMAGDVQEAVGNVEMIQDLQSIPKSCSNEMSGSGHGNLAGGSQTGQGSTVVHMEDVMDCCAPVGNMTEKSLAEIWMDENPFEEA